MTTNKILVTGSSGFVGSHLLNDIQNYQLFCPSKKELDIFLTTPIVIAEYITTNKITSIIHLAGKVGGLPTNLGHQGEFMYYNLRMGMNILEAARMANVSKIVNIGTVCGYHDIGPKPFLETNYWLGLPHYSNRGYGMSKRAIVMMGIEYAIQYNMNVVNLIPINLIGEYDRSDHVCMDIIRKFENANNAPVILWGDGNASRQFCYVKDLTRAINIALGSDINDPWPINIAGTEEITIKNLVEKIKKLGRYTSEIIWDSTKSSGQLSRCLDISRARDVLRWEPQITLDEALIKTIEYIKNLA
jgi:GDP-L-fucose synthase